MKRYIAISQNKSLPSSGTDVVIYLTEETQYSTFYRQVSSSNSVQFSVHRDRWDGQRSSVTYTSSSSMRVVWKWTLLWMGSSSILVYLSQMKAEHGLKAKCKYVRCLPIAHIIYHNNTHTYVDRRFLLHLNSCCFWTRHRNLAQRARRRDAQLSSRWSLCAGMTRQTTEGEAKAKAAWTW